MTGPPATGPRATDPAGRYPGRLVVVTGATRGLGRAMVDGFVESGHTVCGCGRSAEDIAALSSRHREPHAFRMVDVSDSAAVQIWAENVLRSRRAPDLLVNNAGIPNRTAPLWEVPAEEMDRILAVNVAGPANVIRAFVPAMVARRAGVVVNISSGWGRSTAPEVGPYCASKFAVEGMTRSLAQELPPGMAAVAVNPGVIDTDMLRSFWGGSAASYRGPEEWARRAVPFLLGLGPEDNGGSLSVG